MLRIIRKYPLYLFLLPTFFVLHGFAENYGFLEVKEAGMLLLSYLLFAFSIAGFSYIFFRNWNRAALISVFWMSFFFFFGALHEFLKVHSPVRLFSRYSFLLGSALTILFVLFIYFKKSNKPFERFSIYLNLLFIIYIVVDLASIGWKATHKDDNLLSVYDFARDSNYKICDSCARPDVYFLLYDEYSNTASLKEQYGFSNDIDSFLRSKKFSVQVNSRSNYSFTPFSMSSILNMSYIQGLKNVNAVTADDYANCNLLIRDNEVIKVLGAHGYDIVNYSVFDLAGHPSRVDQSFLPLKTKLISDRTLFSHLNKDIGWLLMTKWPFSLFARNDYMKHKLNNQQFQNLVIQSSKEKPAKPRFIYAHFYMPHPPCFYDAKGNPKDEATVYREFKEGKPATYLEYLQYTNTKMRELVTTVQANNPNAVIVVLSDHGYREKGTKKYSHFFRNLNAVYYPDHDYSQLYDSVTAVNQFRLVFNKLFQMQLPLQKDSSVILVDQNPVSTVDKPQ